MEAKKHVAVTKVNEEWVRSGRICHFVSHATRPVKTDGGTCCDGGQAKQNGARVEVKEWSIGEVDGSAASRRKK